MVKTMLVAGVVALAALSAPPFPARSATPAPGQGSPAAFIAYGKQLVLQTKTMMPRNVGAQLQCASCHIAGGTKPLGLSLRGVYASYPQWNRRAARYITVEDRIAECFLYSMNGRPPAYESREMIAITAYIASLSSGVPVGTPVPPSEKLAPLPGPLGNRTAGASTFSGRCAMCHGAGGAGTAAAPPVWGKGSFNTGAGLHRHDTLAAFVRRNMPEGFPPDTLSVREAQDVAAFILSRPRPRFNGAAPVIFQPEPARFF